MNTAVIAAGALVMALCLSIHALFMFAVLKSQVEFRRRFPRLGGIRLIVSSILLATILFILSSLIQILIWSGLFWASGHFDSVRDAMYFSGTTYTTLGTDHHAVGPPYRVFEPLEAMNGTLAAGLNTAILFAILSNLGRRHSGFEEFFT